MELYNLTNAQLAIWNTEQYCQGTAIGNNCGRVVIKNAVNFDNLLNAINIFVQKNDGFRLKFIYDNNVIKQYVSKFEPFAVDIVNVNTDEDVDVLQHNMVTTPFPLIDKLLFEFKMFKFKDNHGGFVINAHHLISDAWTAGLVVNEIIDIYNGLNLDEEFPSYLEYMSSEKAYLSSEKFKKDEQFWADLFSSVPEIAKIPSINKQNPNIISYEANRKQFVIDKTTVERINSFCSNNRVSLYNFFMAVYAIYISRVTNLSEFVIGTPILNRSNFKEKRTIGMFISNVPFKVSVSNMPFMDFVSNVSTDFMKIFRHQKYPYQYLLESLRKKDSNIPNLYNVLISYQNIRTNSQNNDAPFDTKWLPNNCLVDDLNVHIYDMDDTGSLDIAYDYLVSKYSLEDITSMHSRIMCMLEQIIANPNIEISDIEVVTPEERKIILKDFNNTYLDYDINKPLHILIEEQAGLTPNNVAVICDGESITYKELNEKANSLAYLLREKGVTNNSIVGVMLNRSVNLMVAILAVLKAGGAYIPIDPEYPAERILYMLENSNSNLLITQEELRNKVDFNKEILCLDSVNFSMHTDNLECISDPEDLSYLIYTSGSTGKPKGVMLKQKSLSNLTAYCNNYIDYLKNNIYRTVVSVTTASFDIFIFETLISLQKGLRLVIANPKEQTVPRLLNDLIEKENIEIIQTTPSRMQLLLNNIKDIPALSMLKYITLAGEQLPLSLSNALHGLSGATIYNGYGPSETTVFSTLTDVTGYNEMTIGRPLANTFIYILNDNKLCPIGVPGEICIAGDGVGHGYMGRPDLTEKSFVKNPFMENSIMYKSGDLGYYLPTGEIICLGRIDNQIKIRGLRIELGEIEHKITNIHGITNNVVVKKQDENGHEFLCAYYTADTAVEPKEMRNILQRQLPNYMVPQYFMLLDKLPYTPNGKVDKKALPTPQVDFKNDIVPPRNTTDEIIVDILKDLLKLDEISIDDSFLELGGDSLTAINLITRLYDKFNIQLSVKDIITYPIISDLSDLITLATSNNIVGLTKTKKMEYYPATSAQKRLFLACSLDKSSVAYNMPASFIITGSIDYEKIQEHLNTIINRYSALRTHFALVDGEIMQKVADNVNFELTVEEAYSIDFSKIISKFVLPFNLEKGPLFRIKLVKTDVDTHLLLIDFHHAICDGMSLNIIMSDLKKLYSDLPLEEIFIDYTDYSVWENSTNVDVENSAVFKRLEGELPVLNLPADFVRPTLQSYDGAQIVKYIEQSDSEKISAICKDLNITPYMFFLATFNILLYKLSGQTDIIVGSPIANRQQKELQNVVGMFVNNIVLRNKLETSKSFAEFTNTVKDVALESFECSNIDFNALVKALGIKPDNSKSPLFTTMFTYQNQGYPDFGFGGLNITQLNTNSKISKFDFSLEIIPNAQNLKLNFEYCTKLFHAATVERFIAYYFNILTDIINNPNVLIKDINILTDDEKDMIITKFNSTALDYPKERNLPYLFASIAKKYADNIAVEIGKKQITYAELDERSNILANKLLAYGVSNEDTVGVCLNRSIELLISIWAILKVGATYMPMYVGYPVDRLEYMLSNSQAKLLITNTYMNKIVKADCEKIILNDYTKLLGDTASVEFDFSNELPAYIIYTSGSTGKPKGVKISHNNLINFIYAFNKLYKNTINENDIFLASTNISFDVSIWELFLPILNGAKLVLYKEDIINNIIEFSKCIMDNKVTGLYIPPNILNETYSLLSDVCISKMLVGVEPIHKSTLNKYYSLNPDMIIVNGYGPTETTICATALQYKYDDGNDEVVSIGKPLFNNQVYIVDTDKNVQPIGIPGEMYITGAGVGLGYMNNPTETKKNYLDNIFNSSSSKMYKTGDIAKWRPDGTIEFIGRDDNQVKISGYRIELKEINQNILSYPNITASYTTTFKSDSKTYIVAYFTAETKINVQDLNVYLKSKLAFYMVPKIMVQLDNMPVTPNGKVDKKALPTPKFNATTAYSKPRNYFEKTLCGIWESLFSLKKVGIDDDFFDLGGDSLIAIKFQVEAMRFDFNITYSDIFAYPTIRQLSEKNSVGKSYEPDLSYDYAKIDELLSLNSMANVENSVTSNKNLLLVGSTGFLGIHILSEFLDNSSDTVYCIIRPKGPITAEDRLLKTLNFYFGNKYNSHIGKRIKVITGDVVEPKFGLSRELYDELANNVGIVVNSAAMVKHYGDYDTFNAINVEAAEKLAAFCKKFNKKLYHISTTSVSGMGIPENSCLPTDERIIFDETKFYIGQNLNNVYIYTKFEAEKAIFEEIDNGLSACVLRMGNITNRYSDAKFQINISENAFVNRIKSIMKLGVIPDDLLAHALEFTPVDYAAKAVVNIVMANPSSTVFHLFNTNLVSFKELLSILKDLGIDILPTKQEEFAKTIDNFLNNDNLKGEISGIITDLAPDKSLNLISKVLLNADFTTEYLKSIGFKWPNINKNFVKKYIDYFRSIGYFE